MGNKALINNWDYRIVKNAEGILKIHQIFYKDDGTIYGMAEEEISIEGNELEELEVEFEAISKAFLKPIIDLTKRKREIVPLDLSKFKFPSTISITDQD